MKRHNVVYLLMVSIIILLIGVGLNFRQENKALKMDLGKISEEKASVLKSRDYFESELNKYLNESAWNDEKLKVDGEIQTLKESNSHLTKLNQYYENNYFSLKDLLKSQVNMLGDQAENLLRIETFDSNDYSQYIDYYIPMESTLLDNVNAIAKHLSVYNFSNMPLRVVEIKNIEGKKILVVDVYESEEGERSWLSNYFQGSTGGYITMATLVESFLQRESKIDNWVAGVMFTYKGKRGMVGDHIEGLFEKTFYRDTDYFQYDEQ